MVLYIALATASGVRHPIEFLLDTSGIHEVHGTSLAIALFDILPPLREVSVEFPGADPRLHFEERVRVIETLDRSSLRDRRGERFELRFDHALERGLILSRGYIINTGWRSGILVDSERHNHDGSFALVFDGFGFAIVRDREAVESIRTSRELPSVQSLLESNRGEGGGWAGRVFDIQRLDTESEEGRQAFW